MNRWVVFYNEVFLKIKKDEKKVLTQLKINKQETLEYYSSYAYMSSSPCIFLASLGLIIKVTLPSFQNCLYIFIVNTPALFGIFGKKNKKVNLNSLQNPRVCPPI